ncbi:3-phosphoserine/phosphohydroxythreonine transaminase [Marinobacterium sp. D7]|uniref:3-phosphoserine/phosphohydroxythreonine transaminase n=1 Tax=Marinobacterium ramblicola TaxID=2849041 RepID=UPI001C2D799E|nr:3-phosphoserine/phosphohydroxythreonine transaminase [Marinobacterium ramblicola]MBV1787524.1 3-phosphoserine/phosphohydroxythreonine transaminase [Marinobacterium ramblicola]
MTSAPIYNFAAGPAMMPPEVLQRAQAEQLDWQQRGYSVWEMPFTGSEFQQIADQTRQDLRELLQVPDQFRILFMQGGASAQFSLVPLNLLGEHPAPCADYIAGGHWSRKAIREARRYCRVNVAADNGDYSGPVRLPNPDEWQLDPGAAYCHLTSNETAEGLQFAELPDTGSVPLVVDMTSDFLSRPLDFSRLDLAYAGAQKNIGPAGLTLVLIRDSLIREPLPATPSAFSYKVVNDSHGRFNTPLTYAIYLAGLVFRHWLQQGGLPAIQYLNRRKSTRLYQAIDDSEFYHCPVEPQSRSRMNVCFQLDAPQLTARFLAQAQAAGLLNLAGHPACGGVRASLYNAMPLAGVEALIDFMHSFAREHADAI